MTHPLTKVLQTLPAGRTNTGYLSARERAIYRYIWKLNPQETQRLTKYFLLIEDWHEFQADCHERDGRVYVTDDGAEYELILADTPTQLDNCKDVGLSFRLHAHSNFAVVIVKCWNSDDAHESSPLTRRTSHGA